ncbi:hypothetical protein [Roseibium sp.]|uniref:hypothetical protein n=1 Tax=Roseibium sp. TaxID=1936156 RepID=UPI003265A690
MAEAMTGGTRTCPPVLEEDDEADLVHHRRETGDLVLLVAKNVLFWGSIFLSVFGLYAIVAAL